MSTEKIRAYYSALRAFSYPASALPSLTGSFLALYMLPAHSISWLNAFVALVGCLAIHSVSNMVNDYYDYQTGLDSEQNFGMKNPLVRGALSKKELLVAIVILFGISIAIALFFIAVSGAHLLWLIVFGALSAFFYTAPPLKLKYRGLGDVQVAFSFGIGMTCGSFFVHTNSTEFLLPVALASLPQSMLIVAILHANNHRDRNSDVQFGAHTIATRLSERNSEKLQYGFIASAFVIHALLIAFSILPWHSTLVFLLLPKAYSVATTITHKEQPGTQAHRLLVANVAKLQLLFGVCFCAGILLSFL